MPDLPLDFRPILMIQQKFIADYIELKYTLLDGIYKLKIYACNVHLFK
jgi:hypothetical protein